MIDTFDYVYCLNLDKRPNRWEETLKQTGAIINRFEATDGELLPRVKGLSKGEVGIVHSYIRILQDAIKNKYESILILEDDILIKGDFNRELNRYAEQIPRDWQVINFGGLNLDRRLEFVSENIYKMRNTMTTHCIAIKREIYQDIIDTLKEYRDTLDSTLADQYPRWKAYGVFPAVALQRKAYSDIRERVVDYGNKIRRSEKEIDR